MSMFPRILLMLVELLGRNALYEAIIFVDKLHQEDYRFYAKLKKTISVWKQLPLANCVSAFWSSGHKEFVLLIVAVACSFKRSFYFAAVHVP